jgi:hypothetical protein
MQKLYTYKAIKCGFVILCPNYNIGQIKTTTSAIKHNYPESKYICTVPETCHPDEVAEIRKLCPCYKGGNTITSLINVGLQNAPCKEWNFIVVGGSWIRGCLDKKFSYFIESEKDILFPIADRKIYFVNGTINGILIHKSAYEDIGPFCNDNPLEICKLMWTMEAIEKGYRFKAVLGTVIC